MRSIKVHSSKSIRFTKNAAFWCEMINLYKKIYPTHSFTQIAKHFELSETNARRYYYGGSSCQWYSSSVGERLYSNASRCLCDSLEGGTRPLDFLLQPCYSTFIPEEFTDANLVSSSPRFRV